MSARHVLRRYWFLAICVTVSWTGMAIGQYYDPPDAGEPGDSMIQNYLKREADRIHTGISADLQSLAHWPNERDRFYDEYMYMLGLSPLPERTPLYATVTTTIPGDGYEVDALHYQSRPGLYVTANLYRPAPAKKDERLPAVLYVCGHSGRGRNGNKTAFQSHAIWFARHGYVCLVVDSLQLGEIAATHHGTYREQRWWWHSRGYTPAGVECWNGVRGIDYLISRPDVDPDRIAVTGISGGGAATFWIAAADDRVRVAVPVSGMADLPSYVSHRVINGHCDCMFLYNTFQWPWTRIASLVAPRPMLFVNSDQDPIFPMDANERVIAHLERLYSLYGASDQVDAVVSIGGHDYREDIRKSVYRFINSHLRANPRAVFDSEVDLDRDASDQTRAPIPIERLRAFPTDADIPRDQLNTSIDQHFVPPAKVDVPTDKSYAKWRKSLLAELRRVTFRSLQDPIPAATLVGDSTNGTLILETEPTIRIQVRPLPSTESTDVPKRVLLAVSTRGSAAPEVAWLHGLRQAGDQVFQCEVRGTGGTSWTRKNPPNFVERCLPLLGSTVDTGRVRDVASVTLYLQGKFGGQVPVHVVGQGSDAVLAAYAAVMEPRIAGAVLDNPPVTHMSADAPQFLNVLRVLDIPEALGMLAPRPLVLKSEHSAAVETVRRIYTAAGATDQATFN
jgi:dienelactone hydrolase